MVRLQGVTGDDTFSVRYSDAVRAVLTRLTVGLPNSGRKFGWAPRAAPLGSETADRVLHRPVTTLGLARFY